MSTNTPKNERPKREVIINLAKYLGKRVFIKFQGGRETSGKLKGYDNYLNLVLEETTKNDGVRIVICRGPALVAICPENGHEAIENPFVLE